MEFSHVFYKEILLDEDNILSTNLTENNEAKQISFEKSNLYAISGLSINQDTTSNVSLPSIEGKKTLSDMLRTYVLEKKKINLDFKNYIKDYFDITVPFKTRTDVLINGSKYYDTTTQKEEN